MSKLHTIAGISLLGLLLSSAPLTASSDPLPETSSTTPEAPKFRVTKTLLQAQEFILKTLEDFNLVKINADSLPAQAALGFTEADLEEGSLKKRLESTNRDNIAMDHAMKTLRSSFATHLARHRADVNAIISMFNTIQGQIQKCQAMAIAHGTALLEYFIPEDYTTTDARKAVLIEKAINLQNYIKKTLFQLTFDVPSLKKLDISFYFPSAANDENDKPVDTTCLQCGKEHEAGTLCSAITLLANQESVDLAAAHALPYTCLCGKAHNATTECENDPPYPVYMQLSAENLATHEDAMIMTLAAGEEETTPAEPSVEKDQATKTIGSEKIPGYVCEEGIWHAVRTLCEHKASVPYYCSCGNWHTATVQCVDKILVKKDGVEGYTNGDGQWLAVNTINPEHAAEGYPCQCGQWHTTTVSCHENYDGSAYHPHPVYVEGKAGYVCPCGQWHEQGTSCSSENGSCAYLCSCGKMHYKTMDCIPTMNIRADRPEPVYKDGVAGYVDSQHHWFALNTRSQYSASYSDLYLCECGLMHPSESYCTEGKSVTIVTDPTE